MQNEFSPQQIRSNRMKLLALWAIPIGLMAMAGLVYMLVQNGVLSLGSKNNGALIQPPIQISEWAITNDKDQPIEGLFNDKWTIATLGGADCNQHCDRVLHLTRQLHVRLDKDANRVQRVHFTNSMPLSSAFTSLIEENYRYLKAAQLPAAGFEELSALLVESANGTAADFFLIDPQGWAMMYYLPEHEGGLILQDLKHLLKYSRSR